MGIERAGRGAVRRGAVWPGIRLACIVWLIADKVERVNQFCFVFTTLHQQVRFTLEARGRSLPRVTGTPLDISQRRRPRRPAARQAAARRRRSSQSPPRSTRPTRTQCQVDTGSAGTSAGACSQVQGSRGSPLPACSIPRRTRLRLRPTVEPQRHTIAPSRPGRLADLPKPR